MKQKVLFLMLLLLLGLAGGSVMAQNGEIVVGDWDNASTYKGSYFEMAPTNFYIAHTGVQMLYTPEVLGDMGTTKVKIRSLHFKFQNEAYETITRNVKLYLQEVETTEFAVKDDGVKQFFDFDIDNPTAESDLVINLTDNYGKDVTLDFQINNGFAFTPGKTLLVTIVFDAEDDDNCTMGTDFAPFYTSDFTGKAMLYCNNSTSFLDYAQGTDFPDATAMQGCGTNVALPVTKIKYTSTPQLITEQPEGELTTYRRSGGCISRSFFGISTNEQQGVFDVVINGTDAYIKNPSWYADNYNTWVSGTYNAETGIISIPTGQYLYWSESGGYGIQMMWGSTSGDKNDGSESYSLKGTLDENVTEILFRIDEEAETITLLNSEGNLKAESPDNYNAKGIYLMYSDDESFIAIEFKTKGEVFHVVPAVPANPTADDWNDCGDESGYSKFSFTLPTTDVDGNPIDPEKLSYSIYTDNDQLFTFDAAHYTYDIEEDLTEIPYSIYIDAWDFYKGAVYFYRTNKGDKPLFKNRIGIQVHYTVDGEKNSSDIVYHYVNVTLQDKEDNSKILTECNNEKVHATIEGRTIFAGGKWNTLCLPFNLSADQLATSPLAGFEVKELDTDAGNYTHITGYEAETKTLWLNFKVAESIEAGKPYLVRSLETMDASKLGYVATDGTAGFVNEGYVNLVDGSNNTKWCSNKEQNGYADGWICEFKAVAPASVTGYALTTGGDTGNDQNWTRNPQKWTLEAKEKESDDWTLIDSRDVTAETGNADDALPAENTAAKRYEIAADKQGTYQYFRFKVSETGGDLMQLSELTLQGTYTPIDITNPVFKSVIIKSISPIEVTSEDKTVTFVGTYAPVVYEEENKSVLFLQGEKLYYPDGVKPTTIGACRAYFPLNGIYGGVPEETSGVHNFVLNFGDGETTGITTTKLTNQNVDWYSIDGRKLNQKPQQRGIYISNGRKVMVK